MAKNTTVDGFRIAKQPFLDRVLNAVNQGLDNDDLDQMREAVELIENYIKHETNVNKLAKNRRFSRRELEELGGVELG